jgi:hypothetical protein
VIRRGGAAGGCRDRSFRRNSLRVVRAFSCFTAAIAFAGGVAEARPERIRAGHVYYSNSFSEEGVVRDLEGEKNYEEVYQSYRYYEAVYDDHGRVVSFKQVQRGEVVREDRYRYSGDSKIPVEHNLEPPE